MSIREIPVRRFMLFVLGLFFMGIGVAITRHAELGVSPISSVANIISLKFPIFSFGTWLFLWNSTMTLGQIVILRNKFQPFQLLQIPLSVLFGAFTDLGGFLISAIPTETYLMKIMLVLVGTVILGYGITVIIKADVILNSGEAFVKVISDKIGKLYANVKVAFDITCVIASIILSLVFFDGTVVGTREGTIIAALLTGNVVRFFQKHQK